MVCGMDSSGNSVGQPLFCMNPESDVHMAGEMGQ